MGWVILAYLGWKLEFQIISINNLRLIKSSAIYNLFYYQYRGSHDDEKQKLSFSSKKKKKETGFLYKIIIKIKK